MGWYLNKLVADNSCTIISRGDCINTTAVENIKKYNLVLQLICINKSFHLIYFIWARNNGDIQCPMFAFGLQNTVYHNN